MVQADEFLERGCDSSMQKFQYQIIFYYDSISDATLKALRIVFVHRRLDLDLCSKGRSRVIW